MPTTNNLIVTGGINHPFEASANTLARVLRDVGIESEITLDLAAALKMIATDEFQLITIYALRWRMLDDPKYAPFRDRWAYTLDPAGQETLLRHVATGGGLLGLHTASLCFDTWPAWRDLLGAAWRWGTSFHPPLAPLLVNAVGVHPIINGLQPFSVFDEIYHNLDAAADAQPLLWGAGQPLAWAREATGRVVYDALGHDHRSFEQPDHARFLRRAALWALHHPDADVEAA